uniref:CCHC-type domain-containing protein n=1 Tax=Plectus sambesii TaxID=2011161 RepID=A0A914ULU3_9BILA
MRCTSALVVVLLTVFVRKVVSVWCYSCGQTGDFSRNCNRSIACEAARCVKLDQGGQWQYSGCALPFEKKITGCSWLDDGSIKCYCTADFCNEPDHLTRVPASPTVAGWRHTVAPQEQGDFLMRGDATRLTSSFPVLTALCLCVVALFSR